MKPPFSQIAVTLWKNADDTTKKIFTITNEQNERVNFLTLKCKETHILLTFTVLLCLALWSPLYMYYLVCFLQCTWHALLSYLIYKWQKTSSVTCPRSHVSKWERRASNPGLPACLQSPCTQLTNPFHCLLIWGVKTDTPEQPIIPSPLWSTSHSAPPPQPILWEADPNIIHGRVPLPSGAAPFLWDYLGWLSPKIKEQLL